MSLYVSTSATFSINPRDFLTEDRLTELSDTTDPCLRKLFSDPYAESMYCCAKGDSFKHLCNLCHYLISFDCIHPLLLSVRTVRP